ncbi:MAG: NUDIX domain-containing protein [Pseudomonadota bacterium]
MEARFCPLCARPLTTRPVDGIARQACPDQACGWVFWDNPLPVVAGLVEHQGQVLLIQNKGWPPDWWGLVTGFLERGESPAEGVLREVHEELGLSGELRGLIGAYGFARQNQVIIAYHILAEGPYAPGPELEGVTPVPIARLKPWPSATGQAVADWLARR